MCAHVVVAEDDERQAELVRRYLEREGHSVQVVYDGASAIEEVRRRQPELLVLDAMMPQLGGLDALRILRAEFDFPVLMLTALSTEDDLLRGLDLGADDYLTKPYSPRELMGRVRALLRRARRSAAAPDAVLQVGELVIDPSRHQVISRGEPVDCTAAEFRLLRALAAQPGRVFTRGQLLEHAYGQDHYITERTVDVHILNLRKKIERDPRKPDHLVTVYGVGYKIADGAS